jgi:predicted O-methyltransferase YrrM
VNRERRVSETNIQTLQQYYASLGLPEDAWHVGPEHPSIEELAIRLLATTRHARILEVGVQSGGFAVPVILASAHRSDFAYTGIDSLDYTNVVSLRLIADYLATRDITQKQRFIESDSTAGLRTLQPNSFDLILLDHYKPKHPRDLYEVCMRDLLSDDGVIVVHDVVGHAANEWKVCERVCTAFGVQWTIDAGVVNGAAIIRRARPSSRRAMSVALVGLEVKALAGSRNHARMQTRTRASPARGRAAPLGTNRPARIGWPVRGRRGRLRPPLQLADDDECGAQHDDRAADADGDGRRFSGEANQQRQTQSQRDRHHPEGRCRRMRGSCIQLLPPLELDRIAAWPGGNASLDHGETLAILHLELPAPLPHCRDDDHYATHDDRDHGEEEHDENAV